MPNALLTTPFSNAEPDPTVAAIALGSNVGDRGTTLRDAVAAIARVPGVQLQACSKWFATQPVGPVQQGEFFNAAVLVSTTLDAHQLLACMLSIELCFGRDRSANSQRWGPRTLDLDLLVFGTQQLHGQALTLPHPRMHERAFVLEPLCAIAPTLAVPQATGAPCTVAALLSNLRKASLQQADQQGHQQDKITQPQHAGAARTTP